MDLYSDVPYQVMIQLQIKEIGRLGELGIKLSSISLVRTFLILLMDLTWFGAPASPDQAPASPDQVEGCGLYESVKSSGYPSRPA